MSLRKGLSEGSLIAPHRQKETGTAPRMAKPNNAGRLGLQQGKRGARSPPPISSMSTLHFNNFEDVLDAQLLSDRAHDLLRVLKRHRRATRNHSERPEVGKVSDDLLGETVAEVRIVRVGAHVVEREYDDGLPLLLNGLDAKLALPASGRHLDGTAALMRAAQLAPAEELKLR